MVKNKKIEKGSKQVTNPRYESLNSQSNHPHCPLHYENPDQRLPPELPSVNIVVHQVASENPNQEYFKITWQKENEKIHCETSLAELFPTSGSSLQQFCALFARCASTEKRGAAHRLRSTITDKYIDSRTDEPIRTNSRKEGKCITRGSSRKQRKAKKQCKDDEEPPWFREIVEGEESEDDEEIDYNDDYRGVEYSNTGEFTEYYDQMFRMVGQVSLKKILKCWIRQIHPKKQTQHPYNGGKLKENSIMLFGKENVGEQTKPPWWPPSLESKEWERSRHKEPDHQKKPERLVLAVWLLRYFDVEGLKESTSDIAPSLDPKFQKTVPWMLEDIYNIRKHEEKLIKSNYYSGGNSITWIRSYKLKGSIKKINHPPPPSRQSMKLPFVQDMPFTPRSPTPEAVLPVLEPVVEQSEHQPMPFEEIVSPLGNKIDEDQFLLTDESQVEPYHSVEHFVPGVSSGFFPSSCQDFSEDLPHSEKHKVKRAKLLSSRLCPESDEYWGNLTTGRHGMPQLTQRAWGSDVLPIVPMGGPQYPETLFCPNPLNFDVDEQPHRQPRQFHTQQEYNDRPTRNAFQ